VQRCVRRAFLCGIDRYTGQSFEHRKAWLEERLTHVAECFAVAIHAYAIMSNHLHVVLQMDPAWVSAWSDADVAARWVRLFPARENTVAAQRAKQAWLEAQPERLTILRRRLCNLSWLMKCLAEPIARRANAEDACKGRFWEGRYKAQRLCDDRALLAAMVYVDLNPIRAGLATDLARSDHTSAQRRLQAAADDADSLIAPLRPVAGVPCAFLPVRLDEYVAMTEWTGKQVRADKRGAIPADAPSVLLRIDTDPTRWTKRVKGIGSGYWRVVGEASDLIAAAERLGQRWLKGIGLARALAKQG
jgi:hypothetical protein